jgi:hypothetical protein
LSVATEGDVPIAIGIVSPITFTLRKLNKIKEKKANCFITQ